MGVRNKHYYVSFQKKYGFTRTKGYVANSKAEVIARFKASYPYCKILDIKELD